MTPIALTRLDALPTVSGIYIVFLSSQVLYVGKARNIRSRWRNHHRLRQLLRDYPEATIGWFEVDVSNLAIHEAATIAAFNPILNWTSVEQGEIEIVGDDKKQLHLRLPRGLYRVLAKWAALMKVSPSQTAEVLLTETLAEEIKAGRLSYEDEVEDSEA